MINQIAVKNFEYKTAEEIESDGEVPSTDESVDKTRRSNWCHRPRSRKRYVWAMVTTRESGTMAVTGTDDIVWHLVNAVQELSAENALKARLDAAGL